MRRAVLCCLLLACRRDDKAQRQPTPNVPSQPSAAPAAPVASGAAPACSLSPLPAKRPAAKRVVAIGDLHGDLAATRSAFKAAGLIDDKDTWTGKDTVVVQLGDVLDRGDDEQAILDLIFKLEGEAKAAGGELVMLLGNHELMNAAGDFRYVTPGAMKDFDDAGAGPREKVLGPGGVYAKKLAAHDVIAIVGDTVYSHAGIVGDFVTQVSAVNMSARCWLDGQAGGPREAPIAMQSEESPVWTRAFGVDPVDCAAAKAAIEKLGVKRMVVAHTPQLQGVNAVCDGLVWRVDVGLAKHYGGPIEVLELVDGAAPKVLKGTR
ncbi:MAG: metallophosphoesterase [Myxococcota bacterium]|nr:metallophosphoesterase [Myxococcota bacterium]